MRNLDEIFLDFSADKLKQFCSRIEDCLGRLTDEQVWMRDAESANAVGNLVLHLSGNVRQWIVSAVGGEADIRHRDAEFAARGDIPREELSSRLSGVVVQAVEVIRGLTAERLGEIIKVQNYEVTVLEAVYHVVEHFAEHTGQIIFATKLLTGADLGYYRHLSPQAAAATGPDPTP